MSDVYQIRLENVRKLTKQYGGAAELSRVLGYANASYLSQIAGPNPRRQIGSQTARQIEEKLGHTRGWLDHEHAEASKPSELATVLEAPKVAVVGTGSVGGPLAKLLGPWDAPTTVLPAPERQFRIGEPLEPGPHDLPVYGAFKGGFDGAEINYHDPVDRIERPAELRGIAKACGIYITDVSMEPRYYHGEIALVHPGVPVRAGDFVAVELTNGSGLVKQLVRISGEQVELAQFNPPEKRKLPRREIVGLYKIIGTRLGR